jgi:diaminohydroxyphosphoribosylaminopyrimidine deaminase/5-amino-6-(5-phosphoribosylamino)uracil reductase
MSGASAFDLQAMRRALELAERGAGYVEPNPMVGAVVARDGTIIGVGWHERFGGPHAEVAALAAAGAAARGATLYVTLEPCCHQGKTPPCTTAIIAAGIARVVVAAADPCPAVAGGGLAALRGAGITVETGLLGAEARRLTAPYRTLVEQGRPWVIAKWAMSLDGRLAGADPADRWISSPASRGIVHALRGRVDAIAVGIGTALADDPLLTPRPAGPRQPLRIVLDSQCRLPLASNLVRTSHESPVLVAAAPSAPPERIAALRAAGCEVWQAGGLPSGGDPHQDALERLRELLQELGRRRLTNLLVEGGAGVFRSLFASGMTDEVLAFVAPRILGDAAAAGVVMPPVPEIEIEEVAHPGGDILLRGILRGVVRRVGPGAAPALDSGP